MGWQSKTGQPDFRNGLKMQEKLITLLHDTLETIFSEGALRRESEIPIIIETPTRKGQGDYATPLALSLSKLHKQSPLKIGSLFVKRINQSPPKFLEKVEVAGAGYINFFIKNDTWRETLLEILKTGERYGQAHLGCGKKILIEFVSANPTGPLHVAHGRAAALGDAFTRLLRAMGFTVEQEYYINDMGNQMSLLGQSTKLRYHELLGEKIELPQEAYKGDYIIDIAKALLEKEGDSLKDRDDSFFGQWSYKAMLSRIEDDLHAFGIDFDRWFREASLYENKEVEASIALLRSKGVVYDADGAVWVATTRYGDDKDRVIARQNGEMTYFAADIAYHRNKFERGYDRIINIWGGDHHGYVARVKASVEAMGFPVDRLDIVIHQLVNLLRGGKPVAMSKRSGEFVTLKEVMEEVGIDATRFFFLMRRSDTSLDFDLELAKATSDENPVYYVQYAYARLCSLLRVAAGQGLKYDQAIFEGGEKYLASLDTPEEMDLIKQLSFYPDVVKAAAARLEPHRINIYLSELAGKLHRYYFSTRVITDNAPQTLARLSLMMAIQIILKSALGLLGVSAPERM